MRLTTLNTVLSLPPYLVGKANIDEVLDVNGEKFTKLLGDKGNYVKLLGAAHSAAYSRYKFTGGK